MNIDRMRLGGHVRRFHTRQTIGHQTVAEHSWGVAMMCYHLSEGEGFGAGMDAPSKNLIFAALTHDVAEYDTGDVPATAKWANAHLQQILNRAESDVNGELGLLVHLSTFDMYVFKAADMLELMWFCYEQLKMGNQNLEDIWINGRNWLLKHIESSSAPIGIRIRVEESLKEVESKRNDLFNAEPT